MLMSHYFDNGTTPLAQLYSFAEMLMAQVKDMSQRIAVGLFVVFAATAHGAPVVTNITGTVADNQVITINGLGFGTNPLQVEWLGGSSGPIESGTNGAVFVATGRRGWWEDGDSNQAIFDSRRAYSGRQSLAFDPALGRHQDGRFGLIYDTGSNFRELYSSYVAYFDNGGATSGQWKMIRWCHTNSVVDTSIPNAYMSNWEGNTSDFFQVHAGGGDSLNNWFTSQILPRSGAWYRVETYIRPSSSPTQSDGIFWARTTRVSDGLVQEQRFNSVKNYADGEVNRYRYIVFQNYMGNDAYQGTPGPTKVWIDDLYVSQSQARVELCAAASWALCRNKEIQQPLTWSGSQITVRVNRGALPSLTGAFVYVVDSTGAANAVGIPLLATKAPDPATNVEAR